MAWIDPRYAEHQRKRFTRADAYRFAAPGTPEARMPGYPWAAVAKAEAEAKAEAAEQEALAQSILALREEWDELKREIAARRAAVRREAEDARIKSDIAFENLLRMLRRYAEEQKAGFSRDQPRVPKGNPDGGQWTRDAGKDGRDDHARSTDISAQRRIGPRPPGTPAQHVRLDLANARAREAVARVRQLDPNWRPESATSFDHRSGMEVMIRAKEEEAREAEARYVALARTGHDDSYLWRNAQTTADALRAEATRRPMPGESRDARTVSSARFEEIRLELMGGARRMGPDPDYNGVIYRRQDGSEIGLRLSHDHGLTLDILRSSDPLISRGFKVHQR